MSPPDPASRYILTAIAASNVADSRGLADLVDAAASTSGAGVDGDWTRLADNAAWTAIEVPVSLQGPRDEVRAAMTDALSAPIDFALLPERHRRKKLLISDMDSTIIEQECLDELAGYAGIKDEIAAITARAMAGELDFEGALTERVARLRGLSLDALSSCYSERITLMSGAKTLVRTMAAHGAHCVLVSGGFTYFTSRVAEAAGFHDHQGNTLLDDGTVLTGKVGEPILGREAKLGALEKALRAHRLDPADSLAMGDGANDLAMIEAAGLGLAVHAKPIVAAAADAAIVHGDLTAALYFQGFRDEEISWA